MAERILSSKNLRNEVDEIRPKKFEKYVGQRVVVDNIKIYIESARVRDEQMDHVLLYGPPGLGKTTLAHIIANTAGVNIKVISAPTIEKTRDLATVLAALKEGDILFIDEIHRLPKIVEETLYSAMEDYVLEILVGHEENTRIVKIKIDPFTLIGATTRVGDLSSPLRSRFGVIERLDYYSEEELSLIVKQSSSVLNINITAEAATKLASASRGTPRIANRILRRTRDFAIVVGNGIIDVDLVEVSFKKLRIGRLGLDHIDVAILKSIIDYFDGGPVGLDAIAKTIGEEMKTVEDVYEPYLLEIGMIKRTSRGRVTTEKAKKYLGDIYES